MHQPPENVAAEDQTATPAHAVPPTQEAGSGAETQAAPAAKDAGDAHAAPPEQGSGGAADIRAEPLAQDHRLFSIELPDDNAPIRHRSVIDLFRAFSLNNMVAFIGSGTSAPLGYPIWSDFAKGLSKAVLAAALEFDTLYPTAGAGNHYKSKLQKALKKTLDEQRPDNWDLLSLASELALLMREIASAASERIPGAGALPGLAAAAGTDNDDGQAPQGNGLAAMAKYYKGTFSIPRRFKDPHESEPGCIACVPLPADRVAGERIKWLLEPHHAWPDLDAESLDQTYKENFQISWPDNDINEQRRYLLVEKRPTIDVLASLRNDWRISRYVTLNYDHEIERMLEDYSFPFLSLTPGGEKISAAKAQTAPPPDQHNSVVRSRLGERALSVDLCPENASELVLFSTNFSPARVQVLHLHGSVRDPDTMIVTDHDYNQRYFGRGGWADVLNDGQELLFRGNAIVFIGVGMTEEELLRPLRILAQAPGRNKRPVFALLPTDGEHKDTAFAIKLYQRYGVKAIFYGTKLDREAEFGDLSTHPMVLRINKTNRPFKASDLPTLDVEKRFLDTLIELLNCKPDYSSALDGAESATMHHLKVKQLKGKLAQQFDQPALHADKLDELGAEKLPRLLTTEWHSAIFKLILMHALDDGFRAGMSDSLRETLVQAINSLRSAVIARALADALRFVAERAKAWRQRWSRFPGHDHFLHAGELTPAFRYLPLRPEPDLTRKRHVCAPQELKKALLHRYVNSRSVKKTALRQVIKTDKPVVLCLWSSGRGKGLLASCLAERRPKEEKTLRAVIAFGQSCEFDSCFDLIADLIEYSRSSGPDMRVECALAQADLIFTKKTRSPKLAEWDALLRILVRHAVDHRTRFKLVVLCEYVESRDYFRQLAGENNCSHILAPKLLRDDRVRDADGQIPVPTARNALARRSISHIIRRCRSRWLGLFLTQLLSHVKAEGELAAEGKPEGALHRQRRLARRFRDDLLDDISHCLRQVQDPRQRVAMVIDVAMNSFERHVIAYGSREARLRKIVAHAVLRHLFALGTPTRIELLSFCPQIAQVFAHYKEQANEQKLIRDAVQLLHELGLVVRLYRQSSDLSPTESLSDFRLGLHGRTRDYLETKKSLPFTRVESREQTTLTVLPVLAEDVVPLEEDDFDFLDKLFESLLEAGLKETDKVLSAEFVRSAFGLLRGSIRIGTVMRSTPPADRKPERSLLDGYFRHLLDIRRAALELADRKPDDNRYAWPLYEREWVWLFNEMGVVRMLQGSMQDAIALLEQAINFEEERLRRRPGFERLIYPDRKGQMNKQRKFSVTRLRVLMNLSAASLERGLFGRVARIVERDVLDLRKYLHGLVPPGDDPAKCPLKVMRYRRMKPEKLEMAMSRAYQNGDHKEWVALLLAKVKPHRELRALVFSAELVQARASFLSGSLGNAETWLKAQQNELPKLGVHGLTAAFFKIFADVVARKGERSEANKYLAVARAEAEASGRPDAVLGVMLAEAEQARDAQQTNDAVLLRHQLHRLRKIELEARRFGMKHVEATVCMVRARLYLGFAEYRSAREDIMNALSLTTSNGLRVKRVSALIVMAALISTRDNDLNPRKEALQLVETARHEAERMGYQLAAVQATELEIVLSRQGAIEDWASGRALAATKPHDFGLSD